MHATIVGVSNYQIALTYTSTMNCSSVIDDARTDTVIGLLYRYR